MFHLFGCDPWLKEQNECRPVSQKNETDVSLCLMPRIITAWSTSHSDDQSEFRAIILLLISNYVLNPSGFQQATGWYPLTEYWGDTGVLLDEHWYKCSVCPEQTCHSDMSLWLSGDLQELFRQRQSVHVLITQRLSGKMWNEASAVQPSFPPPRMSSQNNMAMMNDKDKVLSKGKINRGVAAECWHGIRVEREWHGQKI